MSHFDRIRLVRHSGSALKAFEGVEKSLDTSDLSDGLRHLVKLRASQLNGCAFCVGLHTSEAREDGETSERLDHVVVWRDAEHFSDAERAALAWTEALTDLEQESDLDRLHDALKKHFSEAQIAAMTTQIAMINVWNRLQIASHGRRSTRRENTKKAA